MAGKALQKNIKNIRFHSSTVDNQEMLHFKKFVDQWWDEFGEFKPLHAMNKIRLPWIRESLVTSNKMEDPSLPLKGYSILDVGCGGGILSEPLAKVGANVTGLDANEDLINSAKAHANLHKVNVKYVASSVEDHAQDNFEKYDAVIASEVIEHVTQKSEFLKACVQCLKPKGSIFLTTINKTWQANLATIFIAENVINEIPKGTHQYEKFATPHELQRMLEEYNCRTEVVHGTMYNFLTNTWYWWFDPSITYAMRAVKLEK